MKELLPNLKKTATALAASALNNLPENVKATWKMRAFSVMKIPMIAFLGPRVIEISSGKVVLRIPLDYRSKNHLNSMYFGALAVGADLAVGLLAMKNMEGRSDKIQLIFKDFKAEYLKRAESDVLFVCDEGDAIRELVERAGSSGERVEQTFNAYALTPKTQGDEPVARFQLTLSLKKKI